VKATVWVNTVKKDDQTFEVPSVTIERSYMDGEEWKTTNSFKVQDLARLHVVTQQAMEYCLTKQYESDEE
jgi:hypothetical protein